MMARLRNDAFLWNEARHHTTMAQMMVYVTCSITLTEIILIVMFVHVDATVIPIIMTTILRDHK